MIKAIVFDFDGTLIDTIDSIWREYERVARVMKLPRVSYRDFTQQMGKPWVQALRGLWPDIDIEEFNRNYRKDMEKAAPIDGVTETLHRLKKEYVLGIMSSRGGDTLYEYVKYVGMDLSLFDVVLDKESLRNHKPDPRALLQVCDELGLKAGEVLYVGDSVIDAECAHRAGIKFVGVLTGGTEKKDFKEVGVKCIVDSIKDLPDVIGKF